MTPAELLMVIADDVQRQYADSRVTEAMELLVREWRRREKEMLDNRTSRYGDDAPPDDGCPECGGMDRDTCDPACKVCHGDWERACRESQDDAAVDAAGV